MKCEICNKNEYNIFYYLQNGEYNRNANIDGITKLEEYRYVDLKVCFSCCKVKSNKIQLPDYIVREQYKKWLIQLIKKDKK